MQAVTKLKRQYNGRILSSTDEEVEIAEVGTEVQSLRDKVSKVI